MSTRAAGAGLPGSSGVPLAPLLTVKEVAAFLGISVSKAYTLISSGAIASVIIGDRNRRVEPAALQQYVASCAANASS